MSGYIAKGTADLFDPNTGAWVGVVDLKGREQLVNAAPTGVLVPDVLLPSGSLTLNAALPKTRAMFNRVLAGGRGLVLINSNSTSTGFTGTAGNLNNPNCARRSLAASMARALKRFGIHAHANGFCGDQAATTANVTANNPNIILGSGVTTDFAGSIGVNFFKLLGSGALSWVGTEPFDTVFVDYITTNAAGGDMTVDIGGSSLATLASQQASGVYTSGPISLGAPGLYTVNIKRAAGATIQGNVVGVRCYNSANPGVLVVCVGGAGKTSANLTQGGTYGYASSYAVLSPDLVICGEQINDWDTDVTVGTHASNIATMITQSKNAGNSDVILLGGPRSGAATAALSVQEAYRASDIASAQAGAVPMIDFWTTMGPNDGSNPALYGDVVGHLTEGGYGAFGYALARVIGTEFL
jgi:lysophospholipase L1-like esterase